MRNYVIAGSLAAALATATQVVPMYVDPDPIETGVCWVDLAQSMDGTEEVGGNNRGPVVEEIQRSTGNSPGDAWCASFVWYVMDSCWAAPESDPRRFGWAPSWFVPAWRIPRDQAKAGDLWGMWDVERNRIAHVGVIVSVSEDGSIVTVEGNTNWRGHRDGQGVHIRLRRPGGLDQFSRPR